LALTQKALAGVAELPVEQRAEVLRVAMTLRAPPAGSSGIDTPVAENLGRVLQEARVQEWPREERAVLAESAQQSVKKLVSPSQIAVVRQLAPAERKELGDWAVESKVLPSGQEGVIEDVARPGGVLDQLAMLQKGAELVPYYALACGVEFLFSFIFSWSSCGQPLSGWLQFDSSLGLLSCGAAYVIYRQLGAATKVFMEDPSNCMERWQNAPGAAGDWTIGLEAAVPGTTLDHYRIGGIAGAAVAILLALAAVWGVVGALELVAVVFMGCLLSPVFFVSVVFIAVRVASLVAAVYAIREARKLHQKLVVDPQLQHSRSAGRDDAMPLVAMAPV